MKIIAGTQNSRAVAIAYRGGRKYLKVDGDDIQTAIDNLKSQLNAIHQSRLSARDENGPGKEEYLDALLRLEHRIDASLRNMLFRLASQPNFQFSVSDLAGSERGEKDETPRALCRIGRFISEILDYRPMAQGVPKTAIGLLAIAKPGSLGESGSSWTTRAGFASALQAYGAAAVPKDGAAS